MSLRIAPTRTTLAWVASLAVLVSGCLADPTALDDDVEPPLDTSWVERFFDVAEDHDHHDYAQHHGRSTDNFGVLGWTPLVTDHYGMTAGGHLCGDVKSREGRELLAVHSWTSEVALVLADVTDRENPVKLGELVMENVHVYDLAMSPDQRSVVLTTSSSGGTNLPSTTSALPVAYWHDACTGTTTVLAGPEQSAPMRNGLVHVDISDPSEPRITDYRPVVGAGHSVTIADIDGQQLGVASPSGGPFTFFGFTDTGPDRTFEVHSVYGGTTDPVPVGAAGGHDAYIQKHPVTGDVLAHLAFWSNGYHIVNVNDPKQPTLVATWDDWDTVAVGYDTASRAVHATLPIEGTWDGRHYTVFNEECGGPPAQLPTCATVLVDTTDPSKPTFVGAWTFPLEAQIDWGGLMYSPHYPAFSGRTLFMSSYHGGVWAIDLSTPEAMRTMPTIGVFSADIHEEVPYAGAKQYNWAPTTLDVIALPDGTLAVLDANTGVHVVEFDASRPAPSPDPWPMAYH